jgi:hypothetical protein
VDVAVAGVGFVVDGGDAVVACLGVFAFFSIQDFEWSSGEPDCVKPPFEWTTWKHWV